MMKLFVFAFIFLVNNVVILRSEDEGGIGVQISADLDGSKERRVDDSTTNVPTSQLEQLFLSFKRTEQLIHEMDKSYSSRIEALSKRINAIESNQKNLQHVMTTDWVNISTQHKLIRVFSTPLRTWPGAKELCAAHSAKLLTINTPQETSSISGYLRNFNEALYWTGGQTQTSTNGNSNLFYGFFHDGPSRMPRNDGCPAFSSLGEKLTRGCNEQYGFICEM